MFRSSIFLLLSYLFISQVPAQDIAIGEWRAHIPYKRIIDLATGNGKMYCATDLALFTVDLQDNSIQTFNKVTGLSDIGVSNIEYNETLDILVVAYKNSNIDLIKSGNIINIADIQRASIVGDKNINDIYFIGKLVYFSCGFGIVVLDTEKEEIKDTYYVGENGNSLKVNSVVLFDSTLYAATASGIMEAPFYNSNLFDFSIWQAHDTAQKITNNEIQQVLSFDDTLFAILNDTLIKYNGSFWEKRFFEQNWSITSAWSTTSQMLLVQYFDSSGTIENTRISKFKQNIPIEFIYNSNLGLPKNTLYDANGILWAGNLNGGALKNIEGNIEEIIPNGPFTANIIKMATANGQVWVAPGGVSPAWNLLFNGDGFFNFNKPLWYNYNKFTNSSLDSVIDLITITINPKNSVLYTGSYGGGLVEFNNNNISIYKGNSSLQETTGDPGSYRVSGLALDKNDNLWLSNFGAPSPISVKKANGEWQAFKPNISFSNNAIADIVIDDFNQKWFALPLGNGILVFNHGDDLEDITDDQYKLLKTGEGTGSLPTNVVNAIVKDLDGEIWVGTTEGIAVFFCPGSIFTDASCAEAQQIFLEQDGFGAFLLEMEVVNTIAIDGANRKWIGSNNGVWLLSADGIEEIFRFTAENSPLLSNTIVDIAIDHESGEVFIGTDKGIISYKSTATEGGIAHSDVYVYPNPVREDYNGMIAVKGLVKDALFKITDISGTLVYEGQALGGQAVWDGLTYSGNRAKTGIYIVFSTDANGIEKEVTKFLMMGTK